MSDPFIGEINIFGFNFAPIGWAMCMGQVFPIAQNQALFALIGARYGGDGATTFSLPNLVARAPINYGAGPGLSSYILGQTAGASQVNLTVDQLPPHRHAMAVANGSGQRHEGPAAGRALSTPGQTRIFTPDAANVPLGVSTGLSGADQPHTNMQPYLAVTMCIALAGIFPSLA